MSISPVSVFSATASGRYLSLLPAVVTLAVWSHAASCPGAEQPPAQQLLSQVTRNLETGAAPVRVVAFGDSITGVYYHSGSQRAWCAMLGIALERAFPQAKVEMVNAGISGNTTVNALARIKPHVLAKQPDLTVVMFGMNDVTRIPIASYETNLRKIIDDCVAAGSAVVLCTPNNVYANGARPNSKLDQFSDVVRKLAKEQHLPLVDFYRLWTKYREDSELAWIQLMSDSIHPNMNGHRLFAEQIVQAVFNREVSLDDVPPPADGLRQTLARLRAGQPVKIIAMSPWGELVEQRLRHHFPEGRIEVAAWPLVNQNARDIAKFATTIRGRKPTLVITGLPQPADVKGIPALHRFWENMLNYSFAFGSRPWDVLPVLPPVGETEARATPGLRDAMQVLLHGKDVEYLTIDDGITLTTAVNSWVDARVQRSAAGE